MNIFLVIISQSLGATALQFVPLKCLGNCLQHIVLLIYKVLNFACNCP